LKEIRLKEKKELYSQIEKEKETTNKTADEIRKQMADKLEK